MNTTSIKWIDATERVPSDDRRVLVCDPTFDDNPVHVAFWSGEMFELMDNGGWDGRCIGEVTHWAELPDAPDSDAAKKISISG